MFGEERVLEILRHEQNPFEALLSALDSFRDQTDQNDDVTLVEYVCGPIASRLNRQVQVPDVMPWQFSVKLDHQSLKTLEPIPTIARMISQCHGLELKQDAISTVLSELYTNALDHGVLLLDSAIKEQEDGFIHYHESRRERLQKLCEGWVTVRAKCVKAADRPRMIIEIEDSGNGFHYHLAGKDEREFSGRGIALVRALCDKLEFSNNGTKVRAEFDLP